MFGSMVFMLTDHLVDTTILLILIQYHMAGEYWIYMTLLVARVRKHVMWRLVHVTKA